MAPILAPTKAVGGLRIQPEQGRPWFGIAFIDVSSACGTCT
jgi:hypothetical protein